MDNADSISPVIPVRDSTDLPGDRPPARPPIDRSRLENATRELLLALGEDPERPGLRETPRRIADSWKEFYSGATARIRPLPDEVGPTDDLVLVKHIDFVSVCEHHLLPFSGYVHVAYQPRAVLLGLSDIPRIVRRASSRLLLQESLTREIGDQLMAETDANGIMVVVDARHGCVSDRGIRQARVRAVTVSARGTLDDPARQSALLASLHVST